MTSTPTYYDILGVHPSADDKTIRQAYLKLSLKHHPDKNPQNAEEAKATFVVIGQAYEVLSDTTERAQYDRALRSGSVPAQQQGQQQGQHESYETYHDAFDATVAGMSEVELAAAIGTVSAVASVVGGIVGSRLGSKAGGGFLGTAGSLVGSMVASQMAGEAARALHTKSIERIAYKEEVRRAVERGGPIPEPPPKANWEETIQRGMDSLKKPASTNDSSSQSSRPKWQEQFKTAVDSAKTTAATAAAKRTAENLWQKVRQSANK